MKNEMIFSGSFHITAAVKSTLRNLGRVIPRVYICVAFAVAIVIGCSSCGDSAQQKAEKAQAARQLVYRNAITVVMQTDDEIAHKYSDYTKLIAGMRSIDLSQCPQDFAVAYVDHIHAWDRAAEIAKKQKAQAGSDHMGEVVFHTVVQKATGSSEDALKDDIKVDKELRSDASDANAEIRSTFEDVERIAVSYGAALPTKIN